LSIGPEKCAVSHPFPGLSTAQFSFLQQDRRLSVTKTEDEKESISPAESSDAVRPKRFLRYFVIWEPDKPPVVAELVRVKRDTPDERRVAFNTDIVIPDMLLRRMASDSEFEADVMRFCTQLGAEVVSTSRVRISCPPNTTGTDGVQVFFNYKLRGHKRLEEVPADKLPADILAMVRADPDYQENEEYRKWYWRYAGKRRSEIVSEEVRENYLDSIAMRLT
jgi:hypothetical protein